MRKERQSQVFSNNSDQAAQHSQELMGLTRQLDALLWSDQTRDIWYMYTENDIQDIENLCDEGIKLLKGIKQEIEKCKKSPLL